VEAATTGAIALSAACSDLHLLGLQDAKASGFNWPSQQKRKLFVVLGERCVIMRLWAANLPRGGVEAPKTSARPGPAPMKAQAALKVVMRLLACRPPQLDAGAPHQRDQGRQGVSI